MVIYSFLNFCLYICSQLDVRGLPSEPLPKRLDSDEKEESQKEDFRKSRNPKLKKKLIIKIK